MEISLLISALLLGFFSGFHCIGMCGPIALSLGLTKKQFLKFHLQNTSYNLGRIFTYSLLGATLGILGEGFYFTGIQKYLTAFAGISLIIFALFSFKGNNISNNFSILPSLFIKIKINLGNFLQKQGIANRFITGILNGFLPCGVVYIALTASIAAGGIWQGALYMAFFGLGTFPFIFAVVVFGGLIGNNFRGTILKYFPIILIILGSLFIIRSLELGIPYLSPKKEVLKIQKNSIQSLEENCH